MKKSIVVYHSTYGSTKKYAQWIAKSLGADISASGEVKPKTLATYDTIIYGGSLHAGSISGFSLIKKNLNTLSGKKLVVFLVGCSSVDEKAIQTVVDHNFTGELKNAIHHFYFRGAFDFKKLNFIDRIMMNMMRNVLKKSKKPLTEDQKELLACYEKPIDWTDESLIIPLIEYVKSEV